MNVQYWMLPLHQAQASLPFCSAIAGTCGFAPVPFAFKAAQLLDALMSTQRWFRLQTTVGLLSFRSATWRLK